MIKEFRIATPKKPTNSDIFHKETGAFLFTKDDGFYISGVDSQAEADVLIAAHNPPEPKEPTVEEKLILVGLSLDDLKVALGL